MRLGQEFVNYTISDYTCKRDDVFDAICTFVSNNEIADEAVTDLIDEYNDVKESQIGEEFEVNLQDIYDDLWNALDNIAPKGCIFCAHEDDPTMVGFWNGEYDE